MATSVGVITNNDKDPGLQYTTQVRDFLTGQGIIVSHENDEALLSANFWIILGGDGTMLRHSHIAAVNDIPLLGINLGTMGFLADVEKPDGLDAIAKVLNGEYKTEKRIMLEASIQPTQKSSRLNGSMLALNDICVGTAWGLKTFSIYVNGQLLSTIRADGIIVATPTGSTAYNLSAGGPILMPGGQMMVITPVCPHGLNTRPLVIDASDIVRVEAHEIAPVFVDGEIKDSLEPNSGVEIQKSNYHATIITTTSTHLYTTLRRKALL